jgi:hypothetical protein
MKYTFLLFKKQFRHMITLTCITLIGLFLCTSMADAAFVDHVFGGDPSKFIAVDDQGGNDGIFSVFMDSTFQMSTGGVVLWDGTTPYDGLEDDDFSGTGSGILLFDPASGLGSVDEASGRSTGPFLPATFSAGPFGVEQYTFIDDSGQYAIYQWTVTNTSGGSVPAKLLLATDWDLDSGSTDELTGFDAARNLVYQQDSPSAGGDNDYTTGGEALIFGSLDNYYQWFCCQITFGTDTNRTSYMNGISVGNMDDDSNDDKEVGVSANLGTLGPGESSCVAIVQAVAQGTSAANGVANLQAQVDNATALYNTIPSAVRCGAPAPPVAPAVVPTMTEWGMIIFMVFAGLGAIYYLRKQRMSG